MTITTAIRSYTAIGVGTLFAGVTAWVLLEDTLRHGAPITNRHIMTSAVLFGTVYFGHTFWREAVSRRIPQAFGCLLLFLAGTGYCVLSSAGRNGEAVANKVITANAANIGLGLAQRDVEEARVRYNAAVAAETKECASGQGYLCKAATGVRETRRREYDTALIVLKQQPAEQVPNADIQSIAETLTLIFGGSVKATAATLTLAYPFVLSLFCEIAAIVAFAIGLGHRIDLPTPKQIASAPIRLISEPTPPRVKRVRPTDQQMVLEALWKAGRPLSNEELAKALGTSESEATKRRQVCEDAGVVTVSRSGKYLVIAPTVQPEG